ncbi:MAG: autotransporter assembly complex family protein [Methylovulum sp.]|nr:autotransporter assembly complex family protein [Methylovulum sp.]
MGHKTQAITVFMLLCLMASVAFADVSVSGLSADAEKNVLLTLALKKESCTAPEWKIRGMFDDADQEIDQALRALGYYHAVAKKTLVFKDRCWQAAFNIESGPRVVIDEVSITITGDAAGDVEFKNLREALLLMRGSPLRHDRYEAMKTRMASLAMDLGYLQSVFTEKTLRVDKDRNTAQIILVFAAGKRMLFGDVVVNQQILEPAFVAKYLDIKRADIYTSAHIVNTYTALFNSGYFDSIDIRPDTQHIVNQRVPVTINLKPKSQYHYAFGAGYDTDIGPLGSATYINRRLNRYGHFLTGNFDLSPVLSTADAEYTVPLAHPVYDAFSFGGGLKYEDTDSYRSDTGKISARLKHLFGNGWKQTLFMDYSYEDFDLGTSSGHTMVLGPGASWLRAVSDNLLRPTRGYRMQFDVSGSYKNPLSEVSYLQGAVSAVWMQPSPWNDKPGNSRWGSGKWIARTELGATWVDPFPKLPTTYRYYAGGINSVRGYAYKELGPKDSFGTVVGGTFLSVFSIEYEHAILDDWGVAAFVDTGNAFKPNDIHLKTGVGLGARWYSPIGPVRVDIALPLDESDSSFQIHFAAGARL